MVLWLLAYMGGALTILSPCILPVLPFVFSKSNQPFYQSGLPLLGGLALAFAAASTLAVAGGAWAAQAHEWGRWLALGLLTFFALALLSPRLAEWASRPFLRLGGTLLSSPLADRTPLSSFVLGIATGLLWAPCAGPILGIILSAAALRGADAYTVILLAAYALGAATSLAAALGAGGKLLGVLKKYGAAQEWVRRFLGSTVLLGVLAIALGWDRGFLTRLSRVQTESLEQRLVDLFHPPQAVPRPMSLMPELAGGAQWINSPPLTREALKGKVVVVDFWTYSCINCLRTLPYIKTWEKKYKDYGLVVLGVHTPEFAFEKNEGNVRKAVRELGISFPVVMDNEYAIWNAFSNRYWPAHYFIDAMGRIRSHHFGEGEYERSERLIRHLLEEAQAGPLPSLQSDIQGTGAQAPASKKVFSRETYLGSNRSMNKAQPTDILALNQWHIIGEWQETPEHLVLLRGKGTLSFRFLARDVHLVMGLEKPGKSVRFVVRVDGMEPNDHHGTDIDAQGRGTLNGQRLYHLLRQRRPADTPRTIQIEFLGPGAQAFAFTFG